MNNELVSLKLELIQWILNLDDADVLHSIKDLQSANQTDWWEDLNEEQKASIKTGLDDLEAGKVHPHSEVTKLFDRWLER
jgi:predicted transcriptional regulator